MKLLVLKQENIYIFCFWYPNEYWRYIVSVFYSTNKNDKNFEKNFEKFLKKLTAFLLINFIYSPSVNAIKDDIYKTCKAIFHGEEIKLIFEKNYKVDLEDRLYEVVNPKMKRALILLHAYLNKKQKVLAPSNFHIEHILPRSWQNTNYNGLEKEDAKEYLEKFGNKVVLEEN